MNREPAEAEACIDMLSKIAEEHGWDQPPQLVVMDRHLFDEDGVAFECRTFPGWHIALLDYAYGNPRGAIRGLIAAISAAPDEVLRPAFGPKLWALGIICEAAVLISHDGEEAADAEIDRHGSILAHPDSIDCRLVHLVTADGTTMGRVQIKDPTKVPEEQQEAIGKADHMDGSFADLMRNLLLRVMVR